MKYKTKKILLISSVSTIMVGGIVGATCAYFLSPSVQPVSKQGIYVYRQNVALNSFGYKYDTSASYGQTQTNSLGVLISNDLLHLKTEGKFIVDEKGNVKQPSYQSYEFSLGKSIVLFFENDKNEKIELEFDSDDASIKPQISDDNKLTVVEKFSSNPKSINNKDIFLELLSIGSFDGDDIKTPDDFKEPKKMINPNGKWKLRKVGFTVKDNVYWVDSNGNKTKYKVIAKDFWYSFMRTKLYDRNFRRQNGGSKELDSYFIKKTKATTRFRENDRYPNEYLFDFFDIDSKKLYEEKTAITKTLKGDDALIFSVSVDRPTGFISILKKFLVNSYTFSAAPSQYIDELSEDKRLNEDINIGGDKKIDSIKGLARKFGIYTYGQTRNTTLFASPYIPVSAIENREVFVYNKYFADQKWINVIEKGEEIDGELRKGLNKIIFEYSGGIETGTYNSQLLNSYLKGVVSEIKYSDLLPVQREKIYGSDPKNIRATAIKHGLRYSKTINTSSLVQRTLIQSNPINGINENSYGFNDAYSKLVFGLTKKELSSGKYNTTNAFFVNDGFEFRLLIQAAINWDAFVNQSFQHQRIMWLSGAAPDAQFSSVDSTSKTPIDYESIVNTLQFIDRTSGKPRLVDISAEKMREWSKNNTNQEEVIKSPEYQLIKRNMKLLLDKNNISSPKEISWDVVYPWSDKDTIKTTVLTDVVNTINNLDSRLSANIVIPKDRDEMIAKIANNTGIDDFNGWGYDYEGIGSYISAFSNGHGVTILNAFPIYTLNDSNDKRYEKAIELQRWFPEFTKLAKFTKEYIDNEMLNKQIDKKFWLENWDKVTNEANQDSSQYFLKVTNGKFDPAVSLAKAFKTYESQKITNEEWAKLIMELNAIKGVSMNADNSILNPKTASLSLYLKDYIVPITKYGISYFQDYRTIEDKK